tara:strand:- start:1877 stop:4378 length:2502 start_codon:yes stop_codon:yes gene_type:complete
MRQVISFLVLSVFGGSLYASPDLTQEDFQEKIAPFFEKHCYKCHGENKQKADRRFDLLSFPISNDDQLVDFQDALDQLNLGEMPPEEEIRPNQNELKQTIEWLTLAISNAQKQKLSTGGETVLRRLNKREYLYTISDLFNLNTNSFDPTQNFPSDNEVHHLDNQGHALVTSGFLLDKYLDAADMVVEKALPSLKKPNIQEWIQNDGFEQGEFTRFMREVQFLDSNLKKNSLHHIRLYEHPRSQRHMGSYGYMSDLSEGVPADGYYFFAFDATALYKNPPYEKNFAGTRSDEPFRLAVVPGNIEVGPLHLPQPLEPELAKFEMVEGKRKKYSARIWLDKGSTPRVIFLNGAHRARDAHIEASKFVRQNKGLIPLETGNEDLIYGLQYAKLPQVRIYHMYLRGPIIDQWPTFVQKEMIGGNTFDPNLVTQNLENFVARAYRRPPTDKQIQSLLQIYRKRKSKGIGSWQAYKDSLKAALCSPNFIYLKEPVERKLNKLDSYAIASRLSYFLWSSMPDRKLLDLAEHGILNDQKILSQEVERMLIDPKSNRFVDGFLDAWLTLDNLGTTPPDQNRFSEYYIDDLATAMRQETHVFFRHILDQNLPTSEFITAEYTFLNPALARHYRIDLPNFRMKPPDSFTKVSTNGHPRGGLLGQASIHTVTANGVDTSPIIRGVWILENILGTPPAPPPPDIEAIEPDIRGSLTIRDQMEKHRTDPTCAECHRKIDPLGFGLENFDAIGRYRSTYQPRKIIDASGILPGGKEFKDLGEFMWHFREQESKFTRALTNKLMEYALGRQLEISDRPEIDRILDKIINADLGFRDLVNEVVMSDLFTRP